MTKPTSTRRTFDLIGKATIVAVSVSLSSCVPTVTYRPSPSSLESAQRALAAERTLIHPQIVAIRERDPDFAPITFCTAEGSRIEIHEPRVTETGICGQPGRRLPGAISPTVDPERCWSFAEISTIGQPGDATTFGYYAVRGYLRCPDL